MRLPQGHYVAEVESLKRPSSGFLVEEDAALWQRRLERLELRRRAAIRRSFQRLDSLALGVSVALVTSVAWGLLTLVAVSRGFLIGESLGDISIFVPGFRTSLWGVLVAAGWGLAYGFAFGFLTAFFRNLGLKLLLWRALWKADRWHKNLLDLV